MKVESPCFYSQTGLKTQFELRFCQNPNIVSTVKRGQLIEGLLSHDLKKLLELNVTRARSWVRSAARGRASLGESNVSVFGGGRPSRSSCDVILLCKDK